MGTVQWFDGRPFKDDLRWCRLVHKMFKSKNNCLQSIIWHRKHRFGVPICPYSVVSNLLGNLVRK